MELHHLHWRQKKLSAKVEKAFLEAQSPNPRPLTLEETLYTLNPQLDLTPTCCAVHASAALSRKQGFEQVHTHSTHSHTQTLTARETEQRDTDTERQTQRLKLRVG